MEGSLPLRVLHRGGDCHGNRRVPGSGPDLGEPQTGNDRVWEHPSGDTGDVLEPDQIPASALSEYRTDWIRCCMDRGAGFEQDDYRSGS